MAFDTLDISVLVALAIAAIAYFGKDFLTGSKNEGGFITNNDGGISRDLCETLKNNNKNTVVFYGSQTGTAEEYASKLSKELSSRFGLKSMLVDFAEYDLDNLEDLPEDTLCFFIMATYGEGEPTDNALEFTTFLDDADADIWSFKYTVFGLGNSTYEFYNAIGKKFDEQLEKLGCEKFSAYGEGDDGKGTMDEDFLAWKDSVFDSLKNDLNFDEFELKYEPGLKLVENDALTLNDPNVSLGEPNKSYLSPTADLSKGPFDHSHPYLSKIISTKELFNSKDRSCIHAEFDISESNMRYSTGDHLAIWPSNSKENVAIFLTAFGLTGRKDRVFELKALDSTITIPFHSPITFSAVITHHLEITGSISRQFLLAIAGFAPTEESKKEVTRLANDKVAFAEEIHQKCYNIADALLKISNGLPWTNVPFEFLIENIGHLQPRYYSISSSSISEKKTIHVTAVVESEKVGDQLVTGVATNLLKNIEIVQNKSSAKPIVTYDLEGPRKKFSQYKLPIHVRRSTFKLPSNPAVPVILIGPGTGVAPFRAFIREKIAMQKNDSKIGKTLLFYGCRSKTEDFLYQDEWPEYSKALGSSFEFYVAYSREDPAKKVYVQHKLMENASAINKLLEEGAYIYVCGDASKMARDVQSSLNKILSNERGITEERAGEILRSFKVQNRYQEDVW